LFLFDQGISKNDLYKKIWPNDKEVSINKIDTHLTNIKNILNKTINFSLKISSKNGLLKLIID
jgi:DNA-binding winged helix-turn-helix (wHTH) protein